MPFPGHRFSMQNLSRMEISAIEESKELRIFSVDKGNSAGRASRPCIWDYGKLSQLLFSSIGESSSGEKYENLKSVFLWNDITSTSSR